MLFLNNHWKFRINDLKCSYRAHMKSMKDSVFNKRSYLFYFLFHFLSWADSLGVLRPSKCCLKKQPQPNLGERINISWSHHLPSSTNIVFDTLYSWLTYLLSTNATKCCESQGEALDTLSVSVFILVQNDHMEKWMHLSVQSCLYITTGTKRFLGQRVSPLVHNNPCRGRGQWCEKLNRFPLPIIWILDTVN